MSEQQALLLQRGGESYPVKRSAEQLTLRLVDGASLEQLLLSHPQLTSLRQLPRQNLQLLQIAAGADLEALMAELRADSAVQFASHVYQSADFGASPFYLMDEVTLCFDDDFSLQQIDKLASDNGLELVRPLDFDNAYLYRVTVAAKANPLKLCNRLLALPEVKLAEPNLVLLHQSCQTPSDSLRARQWHLDQIEVPRAWQITQGERSVTVAVIDDAFDLNHPDLQGRGKIVAPRDFVDRDSDPSPELSFLSVDENHGTACAGLVVAEINGSGVVGVAPNCSLMPIRFNNAFDDNVIEEAFRWVVDHNASVVSCSWAAGDFNFPLSTRAHQAIRRAAREGRAGRGCVILFAAGNYNRPLNGTAPEPGIGQVRWHNGYATHPDVIAVSAATSQAKKAIYSNWGAEVSICAPSNNAAPEVTGPPVAQPPDKLGVVTTDRLGVEGYSSGAYTGTFGGTSAACPIAAGVAALVLSVNPRLSAAEVRQILESTADKITDRSADPQLGNRFGHYDRNGHSWWFGYGRINAFKAVNEALRRGASGSSVSPVNDRLDEVVLGGGSGVVTATVLNLRQGPGATHPAIGQLRLGDEVELLARSNQWLKVRAAGQVGYVHSAYIELRRSATLMAVVTASSLNLRPEPSTRLPPIGRLSQGDEVTVIESVGDWYQVQFGELSGYLHSGYLQLRER